MPQTTLSTQPEYRNIRSNYYSDKSADTTEVGTIITTFKSIDNVYDNSYVPGFGVTGSYKNISGNADTPNNPDYQYIGYIYCDGALYNIEDYPALYKAIGNEYGGEARKGLQILDGGSGYNGTTTITFDPPAGYDPQNPGDLEVIEAGLTVVDGVISSIYVLKLGFGYTSTPSFTLNDAGSGVGFDLQINLNANGQVEDVTQDNVFNYLGETGLGTFNVPDLKARKIVGYGNVYGPGSPTIGLISVGAGANSVGGKWLLDKDAQEGLFSLGSITTTGYTDVTDTTSTRITGSQTVNVTLGAKRLQGVPEHSHFAYHTYPGSDVQSLGAYSGDRYLVEYKQSNGKLYQFFPVGGIAFEHTHALLKQPLADNTVATYDVLDWVPGAEGTGSVKYNSDGADYYFASGSAAAGTYELVTYIPPTTFKPFNTGSVIGGRTVFLGGVPIIEYNELNDYTTAQTDTPLTFPDNWEKMIIQVAGGGGSGSNGLSDGNSGSASSVTIGSDLTVSCGGGEKGYANTTGGSGGEISITGDASSLVAVLQQKNEDGSAGNSGPYYIASYASNPQTGGDGGNNTGSFATNDGTDGINSYVEDGGYTGSGTFTSDGDLSLSTAYYFTNIQITVAGARGGNSSCNLPGGNGNVLVLDVNNPSNGIDISFEVGTAGTYAGGATDGAYGANGGQYGSPNGSGTYGGSGGGATAIKIGSSIVAGAGGGGGAGGYDPGYNACGDNGGGNNTPGWNSNNPLKTNANLFGGSGQKGGNAGCNGGGGGGGGGGIATSTYTINGGGEGGGGGGGAGHGGGYGGGRGMSAFKTSIFGDDYVSSTDTNSGGGYVSYAWEEDRSYWSNGGGGGGAGGYVYILADKDQMPSASQASITVGSGGSSISGVSAGGSGFVQIGFGEVVGYEGGSSSVTVGDIVIAASEGVNIFTSGSGSGTTGGFKLPTTQLPEVEFVGGGGGTNAAASVSLTGGKVSGITLDAGGNGYTAVPEVRIKHGAGTGAYATASINQATGVVTDVTLSNTVTPAEYTHYVKFGGTDQERFIVIKEQNCTNVSRFSIKVARGNGVNGGDKPENGGDELKIYYNTDSSLNFTSLIDTIVDIDGSKSPEISSSYDGNGSGTEATKWYWYTIDLPEGARTETTRFKIVQSRNTPSSLNDNGGDSDHFGICDFIYEYIEVTELQFIPAAGAIPASADQLSYTIDGSPLSIYSSGATGLDATFTLSSQNPIVPTAAIDPDYPVPVIEPYHLCKYLIKAF